MKSKDLERLVGEQMALNAITSDIWYHGTQFGPPMTLAQDFKGDVMWLTPIYQTARDYTKQLLGAGRPPPGRVKDPAIYTARLKTDRIFDTSRPEHMELFQKLMRQAKEEDPEEPALRKSDLIRTYFGYDQVVLPSNATYRALLRMIVPLGFEVAVFSEGSQGPSIAVVNPQKNVELIGFDRPLGAQAAGAIIVAKDTGRVLLPLRSEAVLQPGTWGTWGGAVDEGEEPQESVAREVREETGYRGPLELVPLLVFRRGTFAYHNFMAIVDHEFAPRLNWETQDFVWVWLDELPAPLHFGLEALLRDKPSVKKIEAVARTAP